MTANQSRTLNSLLAVLMAALLAACGADSATPPPSVAPTIQPTGQPTGQPTLGPLPSPTPTATTGPIPSLSTPTPTPPLSAGPLADTLAPQLDAVLEAQRERYRVPGLTATVAFPDGSTWTGASGQADVGRDLPVVADTTFVTGSITKTFVAAAIMQLAEEGGLSIDDPVSDFLPDYPNGENITLRHLLGHTSGIYNYFLHGEYNKRVFNEPDHHWTPQEVLDNFVKVPRFEPGAGYLYSNTNFLLLGMVIEEATGKQLGEVLRERFFDPLGLGGTFAQSAGAPPPGSARGYLVRKSGRQEGLDDGTDYRPTLSAATVAFAAGDIVSTADDLAVWARTLYGGNLLESDSLAAMTDWHQYGREAYGLGTRSRLINGHRAFGHTGSLRGFDAAMWYAPDLDTSMVVLTNRGRIDANPIIDALADVAVPHAEAYQER